MISAKDARARSETSKEAVDALIERIGVEIGKEADLGKRQYIIQCDERLKWSNKFDHFNHTETYKDLRKLIMDRLKDHGYRVNEYQKLVETKVFDEDDQKETYFEYRICVAW